MWTFYEHHFLIQVTKHPSFTHTKKHRLTRQRNLTQPIFFSNEVYQMNNCKQLSTSAVDDQGQINYGQRVNSNGNRSKADLLDSSSVSNDTLRDVKTSFSSQTGVSTTVRKTDFVSLSDILSNKASSSDIKLGVGAISPPIHSKINKKNETHSCKEFLQYLNILCRLKIFISCHCSEYIRG